MYSLVSVFFQFKIIVAGLLFKFALLKINYLSVTKIITFMIEFRFKI
jgi:hypothetical protein